MISKSTLGRKRKEYENLAKIDGVTEADITKRQAEDAKIFGIEFEEYLNAISALNKPSNSGKREQDQQTRDNLIIETQDFLAPINTAIKFQRGDVKLSSKQMIVLFKEVAKTATTLTDNLISAFDGIGGMTMIHSPHVVDKSKPKLLSVHIAGWEDGSKKLRYQYSPRKIPISKRSGYRDDSLDTPEIKLKSDTDAQARILAENQDEPS